MGGNHLQVWNDCLDIIREEVPKKEFRTWFEPIKAVNFDNGELTILVPNKFFYEYLEEKFLPVLKLALDKTIGKKAQLKYQILLPDEKQSSADDQQKVYAPVDIKNPFVIPGIRKQPFDSSLNRSYTFDFFIEGDCNKLGRAAGLSIAAKPGGTAFNPMFIYGDVGLGKTHLAQAIGNAVLNQHPKKRVLYTTSEKFTGELVNSIKNNETDDFLSFYQSLDVLIVDDVQFLARRQKTQEIFFHIFNHLHHHKKQLILTSDRAPKDIEGIVHRLISRFKWGLTADLQPPDFETRLAILQTRAEMEKITVQNEVLEYIAFSIENNIRELEGALISLVAHSSIHQRPIDMTLVKEVVNKIVNRSRRKLSIEFIADIVCEHYEIPKEKILGKTRKREIVVARQVGMYLTKLHTDSSFKKIGQFYGGRDHSTVIYSCNVMEDMIGNEPQIRDAVASIERQLKFSTSK
jgi:chromosomal replication initiator protein